MWKNIRLTIFLLFFIFYSTFSLEAQENLLTLKQQLDRLQREVNDLSKSVFKHSNSSDLESSTNNSNQTVNFAAIDMRIYDLEKDIKNLTMAMEELVFELDEINNRFANFQDEIIFKLENITIENSKKNDIQNTVSEDEVLINTENSLGTLTLSPLNNDEVLNEKSQKTVLENKDKNLIEEKLSPEDQFQKSFQKIRNKEYDEAKVLFQAFIDNNPDNQLSGSAHYWLGELFLLEKNYREAALILAEGYQNYQKSIKAPDMLYKLSEALVEIDKNEEACNTLNKFITDFSSHKLKHKVEKKQIEIPCDLSIE